MPNNTIHNENEKLLKIFAGIRCLNKDQLPRYLEGRLTDVEKHLVEQHLVDCDLCAEALLALQQEGLMEQYPSLSSGIQQYIRDSIKPVSQVHKMEHYARKVKQRESMLIYFWLAAFILGGGALLFGLSQYSSRKPAAARTAVPVVAASVASPAPPPAVVPVDSTQLLQSSHKPAALSAAANPATPAPVIPAVKKDTVKAAPAVKKPVVDSAAKKPPVAAPKPPDSSKKAADKPKDNTAVAAKPTAKDTPAAQITKNKEKENDNDNKPKTGANAAPAAAPATSGKVDTDEYLYKAAMVYQQHGDLDEAISRYKHLSSVNNSRVGEMARYQMAVCYRSKGQMGKAKRMFKEVVRINGTMKQAAQQALDNM
ncbi:tetratricopeptide repeat protein [Chitinophaga sp. GbtcB8]|uniref:tetratricopeptide repeat protein n=1 Tax=Chitinophaga sp. GbtcB8 TaxID=2824753 RepID=UPI001C301B6A|nr:tetratricopeptide repeat protein [Chitinophaga sp. GbtcB8]